MYLDKSGKVVYTNYEIKHNITVPENTINLLKANKKLPLFFNAIHFIQKLYNSYGNDEITNLHIHNVYKIASNTNVHYKRFNVHKKSGGLRELNKPSNELMKIQRYILDKMFTWYKPSKAVSAYIPKRGIKYNAKVHEKANYVLKLDIHDFFGSIHFGKVVNNILPKDIYDLSLRTLLANLCILNGKLPQGAPTSPMISNIVMDKFDEIMLDYLKDKNIKYTRYADDMTFSSNEYFKPSLVINKVKYLLDKYYKMKLNDDKTLFLHKGLRMEICGVVINDHLQVSRKYRKIIRQEMYFLKKYGFDRHIHALYYDRKTDLLKEEDYYIKLLGKINYVLSINKEDKEFVGYKKMVKEYLQNINNLPECISNYYNCKKYLVLNPNMYSGKDYLLYCFQNQIEFDEDKMTSIIKLLDEIELNAYYNGIKYIFTRRFNIDMDDFIKSNLSKEWFKTKSSRAKHKTALYFMCVVYSNNNNEEEFNKYADWLAELGNYRGWSLKAIYHKKDLEMLKCCADNYERQAQYQYALEAKDTFDYNEYVKYMLAAKDNGYEKAYYEACLIYAKNNMYSEFKELLCKGIESGEEDFISLGAIYKESDKIKFPSKIAGIVNRYIAKEKEDNKYYYDSKAIGFEKVYSTWCENNKIIDFIDYVPDLNYKELHEQISCIYDFLHYSHELNISYVITKKQILHNYNLIKDNPNISLKEFKEKAVVYNNRRNKRND